MKIGASDQMLSGEPKELIRCHELKIYISYIFAT